MPDSADQISDYRRGLQTLEQQMQSEYDKAILALSGGALGVSMAFLKDVVIKQGVHGGCFLLLAWICWGLSVTCTLFSYYTSAQALRKAVQQTDEKTIYLTWANGRFNHFTKWLSRIAGLLFMLGIVFIVFFVAHNL